MNESIYLHAENDPPIRPSRLGYSYSATCGLYKSRAGGLVDQCDLGSVRMRISVSALVLLLALLTLSDGYPTLNSIKNEVQRLMLLKPPTTTATATTTAAATELPPASEKKILALMVAGFVGQLRLPDPAAHFSPPHSKTLA